MCACKLDQSETEQHSAFQSKQFVAQRPGVHADLLCIGPFLYFVLLPVLSQFLTHVLAVPLLLFLGIRSLLLVPLLLFLLLCRINQRKLRLDLLANNSNSKLADIHTNTNTHSMQMHRPMPNGEGA